MNSNTQKFTLDDLSRLLDLPKRTIRYYIQQGLVDRPEGAKRGAFYVQRHLDQLLEIRKWQEAGLSLERIRELLAGPQGPLPPLRRRQPGEVEVWSHVLLRDGVELHIEPRQANLGPEQIRALTQGVMQLIDELTTPDEEE